MFPVEVEFRGDAPWSGLVAREIVDRVRGLAESEHVSGGTNRTGGVHLVVFVRARSPLVAERIVREGLREVVRHLTGQLRCEAVVEAGGRVGALSGLR